MAVAGYNIYVDGVKANTSLVTDLTYALSGLTASTSYGVTVSAVDGAGNESAQSAAVNFSTNAASGGSITSDASTVLSLRQHDNYDGTVITVSDVNGTKTTPIGFLNGELDTQKILTEYPSGSVRVVEWYNQKDPTKKYVPSSVINAPEIAFDGVIKTLEGKPTLFFNKPNLEKLSGPSIMNSLTASCFTISSQLVEGKGGIVSEEDTTKRGDRFAISSSTTTGTCFLDVRDGNSLTIAKVTSLNTRYSRSIVMNNGVLKGRINSIEEGTFTRTGVTPNSEAVIGAESISSSIYFGGFISEIIAFQTDKSTNAATIESNQLNYYTA